MIVTPAVASKPWWFRWCQRRHIHSCLQEH